MQFDLGKSVLQLLARMSKWGSVLGGTVSARIERVSGTTIGIFQESTVASTVANNWIWHTVVTEVKKISEVSFIDDNIVQGSEH